MEEVLSILLAAAVVSSLRACGVPVSKEVSAVKEAPTVEDMPVQENVPQAENASSGELAKAVSDYEYSEVTVILVRPGAAAGAGQEGVLIIEAYIEETPGGKTRMDICLAGQPGDSNTPAESVQNDGIQMCMQPPANVCVFNSLLSILDVPYFLPLNVDKARAVFETDVADALLDTMQDYDMVSPDYRADLFKTFTSSVPLRAPRGFSRLKFRVMVSPVLMKFIESLDGTTLTIDCQETSAASQTGAVDGRRTGIGTGVYDIKLYEVQRHMETANHILASQLISANRAWFEGLGNPCKQLVMDAVNIVGNDIYQEVGGDVEQAALDAIGAQCEIIIPIDEELQVMSDACRQPYFDFYIRDNDGASQEILDVFSADIEKLNQQARRARKGYEYMSKTYEKYKVFDKAFGKSRLAFCALSILFIVFLVTLGIVLKNFFKSPFPWIRELCQYIMVWVVCIGGVISAEKHEHVNVDIIHNMLPQKLHLYYRTILAVVATAFLAAFIYSLYLEVVSIKAIARTSVTMPWSQTWWMYLGIMVGCGPMALEYLEAIFALFKEGRIKAGVNTKDQDLGKFETM